MKRTWRSATRGNSIDLYLGCVKVGGVYWDATGPSASRERWASNILLPGIKQPMGRWADIEDAKREVERRVSTWLGWIEKELPGE